MVEINAKVAALISDTQLAFNAGTAQGVKNGAEVLLYRTIEVHDPDTHKILGNVSVIKLRMKVVSVEKEFCVALVADVENDGLFAVALSPLKKVSLSRSGANMESKAVTVEIGEEAKIRVSD